MKKLCFCFFILVLALTHAPLLYGHFDELYTMKEATTIEIGGPWWYEKQYSTSFSSITIEEGDEEKTIEGKTWKLNNIQTAGDVNDTQSLRFTNSSSQETAVFETQNPLYGLEQVEFAFGNVRGGLFGGTSGFTVDISADGADYTTLFEETAGDSLETYTFDIEDEIADGFELEDGSEVDMTSDIYLRVQFNGYPFLGFGSRRVNMDDLMIDYRSRIKP